MTAPARRAEARAARRQVEDILDQLGKPWPWSRNLSRLIDLWLIMEEAG